MKRTSPGGIMDHFGGASWQAFFRDISDNSNSGQVVNSFKVADLPVGQESSMAYATDGRKVGEGVGAGTGVPVYYSNGQWRVFSTDLQVAA